MNLKLLFSACFLWASDLNMMKGSFPVSLLCVRDSRCDLLSCFWPPSGWKAPQAKCVSSCRELLIASWEKVRHRLHWMSPENVWQCSGSIFSNSATAKTHGVGVTHVSLGGVNCIINEDEKQPPGEKRAEWRKSSMQEAESCSNYSRQPAFQGAESSRILIILLKVFLVGFQATRTWCRPVGLQLWNSTRVGGALPQRPKCDHCLWYHLHYLWTPKQQYAFHKTGQHSTEEEWTRAWTTWFRPEALWFVGLNMWAEHKALIRARVQVDVFVVVPATALTIWIIHGDDQWLKVRGVTRHAEEKLPCLTRFFRDSVQIQPQAKWRCKERTKADKVSSCFKRLNTMLSLTLKMVQK